MKVLNKDYTTNFKVGKSDYGMLTIPKGTKITNMTAIGYDPLYNFVDDFSWVPTHEDGTKQYGLLHDLKYYGINVPKEFVKVV
jgi:hypothetical protein